MPLLASHYALFFFVLLPAGGCCCQQECTRGCCCGLVAAQQQRRPAATTPARMHGGTVISLPQPPAPASLAPRPRPCMREAATAASAGPRRPPRPTPPNPQPRQRAPWTPPTSQRCGSAFPTRRPPRRGSSRSGRRCRQLRLQSAPNTTRAVTQWSSPSRGGMRGPKRPRRAAQPRRPRRAPLLGVVTVDGAAEKPCGVRALDGLRLPAVRVRSPTGPRLSSARDALPRCCGERSARRHTLRAAERGGGNPPGRVLMRISISPRSFSSTSRHRCCSRTTSAWAADTGRTGRRGGAGAAKGEHRRLGCVRVEGG